MTEKKIQKVAVLGAGVMGSGIAAHMANAEVSVLLLDIVPDGAVNRNQIAEAALERSLKTGAFMHPDNLNRVSVGNLEDHLYLLGGCDWIIEAVVERLHVKQALYVRVDEVRSPGTVVSSNTSTIPLDHLIEGQSEAFARDFCITHFFNPPRHMRLLEVVAGKQTSEETIECVRAFSDMKLGKGVVECKDTPGFIANRIGVLWMQASLVEAIKARIRVEEADALMVKMGIPKTGVFGLWDLVGIDLGPYVIESLTQNLPPGDDLFDLAKTPRLMERMISDGYTGRKGKGGFYRIRKTEKGKIKESIDFATGEYHPSVRPNLSGAEGDAGEGLRSWFVQDDNRSRYAWQVMSSVMVYAGSLVPEICDDIVGVDEAMKLGYNWTFGPFELIDKVSANWLADRLRKEGRVVPPLIEQVGDGSFYRVDDGRLSYFGTDGAYRLLKQPVGVLLLSDVKLSQKRLTGNDAASLWDIGDGVACLEFHTKMNAMEPAIMEMIQESIQVVGREFKALVLYNEGPAFSAGANLESIRGAINAQLWSDITALIEQGQDAYNAMLDAPFPVVGACAGLALGGGCEVLMHCDGIQAHAETYAGLVEIGVGIVPGWGGCKEMLKRWNERVDVATATCKAFEIIACAKVSGSAAEARDMGILRYSDGITMNRDRLLADAKSKALDMVEGYQPTAGAVIRTAGAAGKKSLEQRLEALAAAGEVSPHDRVVGAELAKILSGKDAGLHEDRDINQLECQAIERLIRMPATQERIEHMLKTGKPLRN